MSTTTPPIASLATPRTSGLGALWITSVILTAAGVLNTAYLSITKLSNVNVPCPKVGAVNCDIVQNSMYSQIGPIPIQFLGLAAYLVILGVLLLEPRVPFFEAKGKLLVFGMTLFGFLYSAFLTGIEAFVLQAWCPYCVVSAVVMTLLFVVSFVRVWRSMNVPAGEEEE
jgi:uncharacterized membrane protein